MKCSNHFGAKRRRLLKVIIVLAPKGAIQNYIKNIRYDRLNLFVLWLARSFQNTLIKTFCNNKSFKVKSLEIQRGRYCSSAKEGERIKGKQKYPRFTTEPRQTSLKLRLGKGSNP